VGTPWEAPRGLDPLARRRIWLPPGTEGAEVVGVDAVGPLDAEDAHAGGAGGVELVGALASFGGVGSSGDGFGVGEAVGDEGAGGVAEAGPVGSVVESSREGLRRYAQYDAAPLGGGVNLKRLVEASQSYAGDSVIS
jgi:hypothetical protein